MMQRLLMQRLLIILLCAGVMAGEVYQYKDANGNTVYTDRPPPGVQTKSNVKANLVDTSGGNFITREAMRKNPVTLWSSPDCGQLCDDAKAFLRKNGIQYAMRNPGASEADQAALKKLVGSLFVPTLQVGESNLKGFDEGQWRSALDQAGYPKTVDPTIAPGPLQAAAQKKP